MAHIVAIVAAMAQAPAPPLPIADKDRGRLRKLAEANEAPRTARQARALLLAAEGQPNSAVANAVGVSRSTVIAWRRRWTDDGLAGVGKVRPGRGRKPRGAAAA